MAETKRTKKQKIEKTPQTAKAAPEKFAVVELAGKQHLIKTGGFLTIDNQNREPGQKLETEKVLLTVNGEEVVVGQPYVKRAKVSLEVLENLKGKKIEIIKYKAKSRYRRHTGYRSHLTKVKVLDIKF